jgi:SIR2-like domain
MPSLSTSFPTYLAPEEVGKLRAQLSELGKAALRHRLGFLIGAGFSNDAQKFPVGSGLAKRLVMETHGCDEPSAAAIADKYELAAVAQQYVITAPEGQIALKELIAKELGNPKAESKVESDLATVISMSRMRRVFTTNFDSLIERCLGPRARPVKPSVADVRNFEDESRTLDCTGVFHLMGTLEEPMVTEDDLRGHKSLFIEELRHELLTKVFVMVGYSFRDDALVKVFTEIRDLLAHIRQARATYIVMPIDSGIEYRVAEPLWRSRFDITLLPLGAGEFLAELATAIRSVRYSEITMEISELVNQPADHVSDLLSAISKELVDPNINDIAEIARRMISTRTS